MPLTLQPLMKEQPQIFSPYSYSSALRLLCFSFLALLWPVSSSQAGPYAYDDPEDVHVLSVHASGVNVSMALRALTELIHKVNEEKPLDRDSLNMDVYLSDIFNGGICASSMAALPMAGIVIADPFDANLPKNKVCCMQKTYEYALLDKIFKTEYGYTFAKATGRVPYTFSGMDAFLKEVFAERIFTDTLVPVHLSVMSLCEGPDAQKTTYALLDQEALYTHESTHKEKHTMVQVLKAVASYDELFGKSELPGAFFKEEASSRAVLDVATQDGVNAELEFIFRFVKHSDAFFKAYVEAGLTSGTVDYEKAKRVTMVSIGAPSSETYNDWECRHATQLAAIARDLDNKLYPKKGADNSLQASMYYLKRFMPNFLRYLKLTMPVQGTVAPDATQHLAALQAAAQTAVDNCNSIEPSEIYNYMFDRAMQYKKANLEKMRSALKPKVVELRNANLTKGCMEIFCRELGAGVEKVFLNSCRISSKNIKELFACLKTKNHLSTIDVSTNNLLDTHNKDGAAKTTLDALEELLNKESTAIQSVNLKSTGIYDKDVEAHEGLKKLSNRASVRIVCDIDPETLQAEAKKREEEQKKMAQEGAKVA